MIRPPKPSRVGICTGGPPVSVQRSSSRPSDLCDQLKSIWPLAEDKAPYFAAFVGSSCKITAMDWAALGAKKTCGPRIRARFPLLIRRKFLSGDCRQLRADPACLDETYVKIRGEWCYLYRAVDRAGRTVDFRLSAKRDVAAAKAFFRKASKGQHDAPRTITLDGYAASHRAVRELKFDGLPPAETKLRSSKY